MDVPRPQSARGRMLARQRLDEAAGRFPDRIFAFDFGPIRASERDRQILTVTSMGGRHVRFLAMQGRCSTELVELAMARLQLQVQINGQEDLIASVAGPDTNRCSFALLFSLQQRDGWFWFRAAPRIRAGDLLSVTIINTIPAGEGAPTLQPQFAIRMIDDALWQDLFVRDARASGWI